MLKKVKYNIGDKIKTKIHFKNDHRSEVVADIHGIEIDGDTDKIKYKIHIDPTENEKQMGCTGSIGYVYQDDILDLLIGHE